MNMDDVCARCSKFSGHNLTWSITTGRATGAKLLTIEDKADKSDNLKPRLTVMLALPDSSILRAIYGRLQQWDVTVEEQTVMVAELQKAESSPAVNA